MKNNKFITTLIVVSIILTFSFVDIDRNVQKRLDHDFIHISSKPMLDVVFRVGVPSGPVDLDPHDAWDAASISVIDQVCEGLFAYNLSDPGMEIIPNLALSGTWNPTGTEYTCILRQGVSFHDGASFNADAVLFTWNRLSWALNATGTNFGQISSFESMYKLPDGRFIVSNVIKNDDYNITFVLNDPYVPFEALLCFSGSYMLSPVSTPPTSYIDTATGDLVGTGPFVYDNYAGVNIEFHAFDNYWKGEADISYMTFIVISDSVLRHNALLAANIDFMYATDPAYFSIFKSATHLEFLNTSTTGNAIYYLGMNNMQINRTIREAISYAIDYDYIINSLQQDRAKRLKSPIPNGILYANDTFDAPILNLTRARLAMQSIGFGVGFALDNDTEWVNQESTAPFLTYNYTYNSGNQFREDCFILLQNNLAKIGIRVTEAAVSYMEYYYKALGLSGYSKDMLQLFWWGWGADTNDPSTVIDPNFENGTSIYNTIQYNGYQAAIEAGRNPYDINDNVQLLMEAALTEIDPTVRKALYDRAQKLLVEEDYSSAWGYVYYLYHAYDNHLSDFPQNGRNILYFYPCSWNKTIPLFPSFVPISSDADDPDPDGNFNVNWGPSTYTDNYSLYVSSSPITQIDGSVTRLLNEVSDMSYFASGYSPGTYYFLVVAKNGNGNTTSNNLQVNVAAANLPASFILSSTADSPDTDGDFSLTWTMSTYADNYSLYSYNRLITEINGSLALLLDEVTDLTYDEYNYASGTYYFVVVAKNEHGITMSNNVQVIVQLADTGPTPPEIPGYELWTILIAIASASIIVMYTKKKKYSN